jgi:hypothetical protein
MTLPSTPPYVPSPSPTPAPQSNGPGIAALVLGIIAAVVSFIPIINQGAFVLGPIAVILGVVGLVLKGRQRGGAIAGLILGAVSMIIAGIMIAVTLSALDAVSDSLDSLTNKTDALILDDGWELDNSNQFFSQITGTVSNSADEAFTGLVTITFDVLDEDGSNIGSCVDSINTVDAGGKWKFDAMCAETVQDKSQVRFKEISGI